MGSLVDPTGLSSAERRTMAPRKGNLKGATVGLMSSSKRNSDILLAEIGAILIERYGAKELIVRTKPSFAVPAPVELLDELAAKCDVVVTGVGD